MKRMFCQAVFAVLAILPAVSVTADGNKPELLFYHSFDNKVDQADFAAAPATITAAANLQTDAPGRYGNAVGFPAGATAATLRVELGAPPPAAAWTIGVFNCLFDKEAMLQPETPFLSVLDQDGRPLFSNDLGGRVKVFGDDGTELVSMECFDAIYWIGGETPHLAFTYDADGAAAGTPRGKLTVYWDARPYACAYVDFGERRPTTIIFGGDDVSSAADELTVFAGALPMRAVYDLVRRPRKDTAAIRQLIADHAAAEAARPDAVRREAWRTLARAGRVFEAEAGQPEEAVLKNDRTVSASAGAALKSGDGQPVRIKLTAAEAGTYAISLRYAQERIVDLMWPARHPEAKTAWTHNYFTVAVRLNGRDLGTVDLYPTGTHDGHRGDVETWSWVNLAAKVELPAGESTLELQPAGGIGNPNYDAVLLSTEPGPTHPYPRWVDQYRIPPAWWIAGKQTETKRRLFGSQMRTDTYTVELRNRTDEPYTAGVVLETDMLGEAQTVSTDTKHIELGPHETKTFEVKFETPADKAGSSGYVRVILWHDDVALWQEYRIWNHLPRPEFAQQKHPALMPPPDPEMQAKFRAWLETRDEAALTPELKKWAGGPDKSLAAPEYKALEKGVQTGLFRMFRVPLLGDRLEKLDFWMAMSPEQFDRWLPDAAAENHNYGTTWDRVSNALTGSPNGLPRIVSLEPPMDILGLEGDLDMVTGFTAEGDNFQAWRDRKEKITTTKEWKRDSKNEADVFLPLRLIRAGLPVGTGPNEETSKDWRDAGLWILGEAYYLTGDRRYAQHAAALITVFARKFTYRTNQFFAGLIREDRDWWGTRLDGRYHWNSGMRFMAVPGTILLDLCWTGLDEAQRLTLEHNMVRFVMQEVSEKNMWDDPDKRMKVNREDMPGFIAFARIVGDAGPYRGLEDYFRRVNPMVLEDGIHICSIGSYGGVIVYIGFMQKLASLGVNVVTGNQRLRNAFLNHTRFAFSCGSLQPMDDGGGGQNQTGLNVDFGSPTEDQAAWGHELYGDPLIPQVRPLLKAVTQATPPDPKKRPALMRAFYAPGADGQPAGAAAFPLREIWPPVFVAPVKGIAMLRNRHASDPLDWIEVIYDYGKYGARFHGHPSKLAILTACNGQVASCDHGDSLRNDASGANAFVMGGYSHNTVQVNYQPHKRAGGPVQIGELIAAGGDDELQWIDAHSDRMFSGVYMRRTTFVTAAGIVEFYLCRSDRENVYDWPYHNFGIAESAIPLKPTDVSSQGLLSFAVNARSGAADGLVQVLWTDRPRTVAPRIPPPKGEASLIDEDVFVRLWALPEKGTELLLFAGPTHPDLNQERQVDHALLRRKAASTVFATVIEPWRAATGPKISAVEKVPVLAGGKPVADTEACATMVRRTDGTNQVFFVNYSGGEKTVGKVTTAAKTATWTLSPDGAPGKLRTDAEALYK